MRRAHSDEQAGLRSDPAQIRKVFSRARCRPRSGSRPRSETAGAPISETFAEAAQPAGTGNGSARRSPWAQRLATRATATPRFRPRDWAGPRLPSGLGQGQLSSVLAGVPQQPQQQDSWAHIPDWTGAGAQSPNPLPRSSATARMARRIVRTWKPPDVHHHTAFHPCGDSKPLIQITGAQGLP